MSNDLAARAAFLEIDLLTDLTETPAVRVYVGDHEVRLYRGPGSIKELRAQFLRLINQYARQLMAKHAVLVGEWEPAACVAAGWMLKGRGVVAIFYESGARRDMCIGYLEE